MPLKLYYHPLSSYCHKALIALYEHGTAFETRLINLGDAADRAELEAIWPICKFPVLRDNARGKDIPEATILIEYLEQWYPGRQRLLPADPQLALDVRLWDRLLDQYVHTPMQEIVADRIRGGGTDLSRTRATLATAYGLIDARMAQLQWIGGADFSLADCAAAPALFYASIVEPFAPTQTHLAAYFERLMARPSVQRVIDQARPYFAMFPFVDAMPARFREG